MRLGEGDSLMGVALVAEVDETTPPSELPPSEATSEILPETPPETWVEASQETREYKASQRNSQSDGDDNGAAECPLSSKIGKCKRHEGGG